MSKRSAVVMLILLTFIVKAHAQFDNIPYSYKFPFQFTKLEELTVSTTPGDTLKPFYKNGTFYYINTRTQKILGQQLFDEAYPFDKKYAVIKTNKKYGIINRQGVLVVEPAFGNFDIADGPTDAGIMFFSINEARIHFDYSTGKLEENAEREYDPYFAPKDEYKENGKYGILIKGKKKTKPIYDSIVFTTNNFALAKLSGKFGLVDTSGAVITPFEYSEVFGTFPDFALKKESEWYYYRFSKFLFKSKFQPVELTENKLIFKTGNYYNYFDRTGRIMLADNYKWISYKSCLAIDRRDQVVLLEDRYKKFVYYKKVKND